MTDHSTARALVEKARNFWGVGRGGPASDLMHELADFIEQTLTPPEGDTLSDEVVEAVAIECHHASCANVPRSNPDYRREDYPWKQQPASSKDAWRAIARAALQSRVSPQEGLREALEETRWYVKSYHRDHGGSKTARLLAKIDAALSASRMSEDAKQG